jgi:putative component of membrane protein insertase Oxa1/YidC/SpoIIIJ protein YidD
LGWDAFRPPDDQLGAAVAKAALRAHRGTTAVWFDAIGVRCRFEPSCSRFAEEVLDDRGWLAGMPVILGRIARCGPWTPAGTRDPWPPEVARSAPTPVPSRSSSETAKE